VPKRTFDYIRLLKNTYGESFHIHLYTSGIEHKEKISDFAASGLDEIRFHPIPQEWNRMDSSNCIQSIENAVKTDMDVAIEIPVIPMMEKEIVELVKWSDSNQINWINFNELEFSERNEKHFRKKGFIEKNDVSAAVQQSEETAYRIIEEIVLLDLDIGVHYCSASFKDRIQLKNRMLRRAKNIANPIDIITDDATLLKGFVETLNPSIDKTTVHCRYDTSSNSTTHPNIREHCSNPQ